MEKIKVELCTGTACHLMGTYELKEYIENLPKDLRDQIELSGVTCFQKCGQGPNVKINGQLHSNVNQNVLNELLEDLFLKKINLN